MIQALGNFANSFNTESKIYPSAQNTLDNMSYLIPRNNKRKRSKLEAPIKSPQGLIEQDLRSKASNQFLKRRREPAKEDLSKPTKRQKNAALRSYQENVLGTRLDQTQPDYVGKSSSEIDYNCINEKMKPVSGNETDGGISDEPAFDKNPMPERTNQPIPSEKSNEERVLV